MEGGRERARKREEDEGRGKGKGRKGKMRGREREDMGGENIRAKCGMQECINGVLFHAKLHLNRYILLHITT